MFSGIGYQRWNRETRDSRPRYQYSLAGLCRSLYVTSYALSNGRNNGALSFASLLFSKSYRTGSARSMRNISHGDGHGTSMPRAQRGYTYAGFWLPFEDSIADAHICQNIYLDYSCGHTLLSVATLMRTMPIMLISQYRCFRAIFTGIRPRKPRTLRESVSSLISVLYFMLIVRYSHDIAYITFSWDEAGEMIVSKYFAHIWQGRPRTCSMRWPAREA